MTARDCSLLTNCRRVSQIQISIGDHGTYLPEKPGNQVSEHDSFIGFRITWGAWNPSCAPQVSLPLVQVLISSSRIEEKDSRRAVNQPSPIQKLNPPVAHRIEGGFQRWVGWLKSFNLDRRLCEYIIIQY